MVRFGKEEPRSTDEKMATAFAIAIFEPCGVNSDVGPSDRVRTCGHHAAARRRDRFAAGIVWHEAAGSY